jgi:CheY-like chemotaxis protein
VSDDARSPVIVLAVESPTASRVIASVLGRAGYDVTPVRDGVAAVQAATAGPADAVVAFAALPRLSGFALTRLLREDPRTAHLPVLLLTAPGTAAERHWATLCGADRALPTDVQAHDLVAAVRAEQAAAPAAASVPAPAGPDADDVVLTRAAEVLEQALFEMALVAEVTGLSSAGLGAEGAVAGLLAAVARAVDAAFVAVMTPDPPLALVLVNQPASRMHYRDLLLRLTTDMSAATGERADAAAVDARAADPRGLLGADEQAHLAHYHAVPLTGVGGGYVGHLAVSSSDADFGSGVLRTLTMLADPAGRLVATVTGKTSR